MKRLLSFLLVVLLILSLGLTGCSKGNNPAPPVAANAKKDILTTTLPGDQTTLLASKMSNKFQLSVMINIYDALTKLDEQFKLIPGGLAKKWDVSKDGKEYTFYLEEGVKFHNGDTLKASDVKFTVEMYQTHPEQSAVYYMIDHAEVVNDNTAKIVLKYPYSSFPSLIAYMFIMPEKAYKEAGEQAFGRKPIGTGPYKFESWAEGQKIALSAFKDYYRGPAKIKDLVFKIITDTNAAYIALETGDVDFITSLNEMDYKKAKANDKLSTVDGESIFICYVPINCTSIPDKRVRQAILYAANPMDINLVANEGTGSVTGLPVVQGSQGHTTDFPKYETNIEKAKQLLKEAGYEKGLKLKMTYYVKEVSKKRAETLQAQLAQAGITVEIQTMEMGAWFSSVRKGEQDLTVCTMMMVPNNIDYSYSMMFHSKGQYNLSQYRNSKLDKMLEDARVELDTTKQATMYQEITRFLLNEAVMIPCYFERGNAAFNKNLKGVKLHPRDVYSFYNFSY